MTAPIPLGKRDMMALRKISTYPGPYYWKPVSMQRLAERGLVRAATGRSGGFRITAEGVMFLATHPLNSG